MPKPGGHDTESKSDGYIDLVAVEAAEAAEAEGEDIAIVTQSRPPAPNRRKPLLVAALAGVAATGIAAAVALVLTGDNDEPSTRRAVQTDEQTATSVPSASTAPATSPATEPVVAVPEPTVPVVVAPPATRAPTPLAPVVPETPVAPATATLEATLEPAAVSVSAGFDVAVTLRVRNTGGAAGSYTFDNDGCDPYLVHPADVFCTQTLRTLEVPAGGTATQTMIVRTSGASPGEYVVSIGDRELRVTVV